MEASGNDGESPIARASAWVDSTRSQVSARVDSTRAQVSARVDSTRAQVTGWAETVAEPDAFAERPEVFVGAAFAGGLVLAGLIRLVGR